MNDQERRTLGEPRIDRNLYAREAGWAISALVALHEATGKDKWLAAAMDAARGAIAQRLSPSGGWRHDAEDNGGPFMTTNLAMASATLDLYRVTPIACEWLDEADGALPNPDVTYPTLARPALFACIEKRCSLPIYAPEEARRKLDRLFGRTG